MGRRTILLLVAVVIAGLGATLVFLYVQGVEADATQEVAGVQVLTAAELIPTGETIENAQNTGKLTLTTVPQNEVLDGALTSTKSIEGKLALTDIYPGEQILPGRFGASTGNEKITIPKGTMAISVQLSDPARVAGFVSPGSQVSIFLSGTPEAATADGQTATLPTFTRMLLPKVEVIGVGATTLLSTTKTDPQGAETTEQIPTTILTLALTQDQAERVIYGSGNGDLTLGLLNEDSKPIPGPGVTAADLFKE